MAISIKNPEVEEEIRRLAAQLRVDLTEAVHLAVSRELAQSSKEQKARLSRMRAISRRIAALPLLDGRFEDEILGYDEQGMPR